MAKDCINLPADDFEFIIDMIETAQQGRETERG